MGQSYGTLLGATYAEMFPTHVRAMVLDSAIDPALPIGQFTLGQAKGFEGALSSFFTWCAASTSCPWQTTDDPTAAILALIARSRTGPAPAGSGRTAGPGEMYNALLEGLYAESDWPTLGTALADDAEGNGAPIVTMSDRYLADGSTNGSDAGEAIDCLDHPVSRDVSGYATLAAQYGAVAPVFGPFLAWGSRLRRVAGGGHTDAGSCYGGGLATHSGDRYDGRSGHALCLGRQFGPPTQPGRSPEAETVTTMWPISTVTCVRSYVQTYLVGGVHPPRDDLHFVSRRSGCQAVVAVKRYEPLATRSTAAPS